MISLWFPIIPEAKQSFRYNKLGHKFKAANVKEQEHTIKSLLINQLPKDFKPSVKGLKVRYEFCFPYPSYLPKCKKSLQELFKAKRPDIDNLQKSINDALNSIVFRDDGQIVEVHAIKVYRESVGIRVTIIEIDSYF